MSHVRPSPSRAVQTLINTINTVSAHIFNFKKLLTPKFIANVIYKIYNKNLEHVEIILYSQRHRVNTYLSCCVACASVFKFLYLPFQPEIQ
ncbi:GSCOCG00004487001-RA-CDS [Cotesia congregata]|nr:GSCOCG00004487001-RA-CDS [Cotesia congregata]